MPWGQRNLHARAILLLALAAVELPFLAFLYDPIAINDTDPAWLLARIILREVVPISVFFLATLCIVGAPKFVTLSKTWRRAAVEHQWRTPLVVNIAMIAILSVLTVRLNQYGSEISIQPPWLLFSLWVAAVGAAYVALAVAFAPPSYWRETLTAERMMIALAGGAALFIEFAAILSRQSWNALSEATFRTSAFLLSLYESDTVIIADKRVLGVGDFLVNIAAACSGYEGIGLVATFLAIYLWIFRSALKFPNVFLILPIGIAAIWVLNSVRIAALISLGAHISPEVAVTGFHSQAGWMMFLLVTVVIMLITHRIEFFHEQSAIAAPSTPSPAFRVSIALLAPFLAMTAAGIIAAAFTHESYWQYALRVIAISIAVVACWRYYRRLDWRVGGTPIVLGLIVGAAWIATDPAGDAPSELGQWLGGLTPAAMALWLFMRIFGTIILVPMAEEMAFRGYLHRKLIAEKFEAVAEGAFSWKAFLISSALFGVLHDRWLAGALAGAVFALALYRTGKIAGAIAAHMSANALIAFWAIVFGQWTLL